MRKRTILRLEVIAFNLVIIGLAVYLLIGTSVVYGYSCPIDKGCITGVVSTGPGPGTGISILLFIVAGIVATVAWIGALIRSARMQDWVWFVIVLLLHGLGTLMYAIAGPSDRPAMVASPP